MSVRLTVKKRIHYRLIALRRAFHVDTQLVTFKTDDYVCKAAKSLQEALQLIEAGFEYVTEMENVKLFRKRK